MAELTSTPKQSKRPAIILTFLFIIGIALITYSSINIAKRVELKVPKAPDKPDQVLSEQDYTYLVTEVVDGDTIKIDYKGETKTVRLIGIDTPETRHPLKGVECFGREASAKMSELSENEYVRIEPDPSQGTHDRYGRLLLYVWRAKDNLFINETLIKQGFAYEYTYRVPYKYLAEFKAAENYARQNSLGLWGETCR